MTKPAGPSFARILEIMEHVEEHADELRLDLDIGEIDTTWVIYGKQKRFQGEVIGIPSAELYRQPQPA